MDAKIVNRDSPGKPQRTFVAYCVVDEGKVGFEELNLQEKPDAVQTDAAELYAIDFAMRELGSDDRSFVLWCDNESVVDVLRRNQLKVRPRTRPILKRVWDGVHADNKFRVEKFPANLADRHLRKKWQELKTSLIA